MMVGNLFSIDAVASFSESYILLSRPLGELEHTEKASASMRVIEKFIAFVSRDCKSFEWSRNSNG